VLFRSGALLGLFGVLVIYKIQSAKSNLIGFGQSVLDVIKYEIQTTLTKGVLNSNIVRALKVSIFMQDIEGINRAIQTIELKHETIDNIKKSYDIEKQLIDTLIKSTIRLSILTVVLISICLAVLPLGGFFLKHQILLIILFVIVTLATIYNLMMFIHLLYLSFKSWGLF
jgi:hypothetical protein